MMRAMVFVMMIGLVACGDEWEFDWSGACVSDPVSYYSGDRVYCYDGWDRSDCTTNDNEEVNGAGWSFHGGKDCWELDLSSGSNPYDGASPRNDGGYHDDNGYDDGNSCQPSLSECGKTCRSEGYNASTGECSNGGQTCECTSAYCGGCVETCLEDGYTGFSGVCDPGTTSTCYCSNNCGNCEEVCVQAGYQEFTGTCAGGTCFCR